jgi:hypothetical protein
VGRVIDGKLLIWFVLMEQLMNHQLLMLTVAEFSQNSSENRMAETCRDQPPVAKSSNQP